MHRKWPCCIVVIGVSLLQILVVVSMCLHVQSLVWQAVLELPELCWLVLCAEGGGQPEAEASTPRHALQDGRQILHPLFQACLYSTSIYSYWFSKALLKGTLVLECKH